MQKMISLFQRNYDTDHLVRDEVVPGAEWVLAGEGVPTVKLDGTCCRVHHGRLYKRHEVKKGKQAPEGFEPAGGADPKTGKQVGWVAVGHGPEDRWHREAWEVNGAYEEGTYELIGPKVQGNPEQVDEHMLVRHGHTEILGAPRDFDGLRQFFQECNVEGIVWHHPDGRMVKIKAKDFGLPRGPGETHWGADVAAAGGRAERRAHRATSSPAAILQGLQACPKGLGCGGHPPDVRELRTSDSDISGHGDRRNDQNSGTHHAGVRLPVRP